jgi:hypothetical protein
MCVYVYVCVCWCLSVCVFDSCVSGNRTQKILQGDRVVSKNSKILYCGINQKWDHDYVRNNYRDNLDELLGISTVSMDFDESSVEGEIQFQVCMQVQQVSNDTDPLMWWKWYQEEFPDLSLLEVLCSCGTCTD